MLPLTPKYYLDPEKRVANYSPNPDKYIHMHGRNYSKLLIPLSPICLNRITLLSSALSQQNKSLAKHIISYLDMRVFNTKPLSAHNPFREWSNFIYLNNCLLGTQPLLVWSSRTEISKFSTLVSFCESWTWGASVRMSETRAACE